MKPQRGSVFKIAETNLATEHRFGFDHVLDVVAAFELQVQFQKVLRILKVRVGVIRLEHPLLRFQCLPQFIRAVPRVEVKLVVLYVPRGDLNSEVLQPVDHRFILVRLFGAADPDIRVPEGDARVPELNIRVADLDVEVCQVRVSGIVEDVRVSLVVQKIPHRLVSFVLDLGDVVDLLELWQGFQLPLQFVDLLRMLVLFVEVEVGDGAEALSAEDARDPSVPLVVLRHVRPSVLRGHEGRRTQVAWKRSGKEHGA